MVAYSFKRYFSPQIEAGIKLQTVRADRRRHARPGELVQLFEGMRTRYCRRIRPDVICESVAPIVIELGLDGIFASMVIDGHALDEAGMETFARQDGFAPEHFNEPSGYAASTALENMETFWLDNHPAGVFRGVIIKWRPVC